MLKVEFTSIHCNYALPQFILQGYVVNIKCSIGFRPQPTFWKPVFYMSALMSDFVVSGVNETVIIIIHIHERNCDSSALISYLFKKCRILSSSHILFTKFNPSSTLWITKPKSHDSTLFTFTPWSHLCDIVFKNKKKCFKNCQNLNSN